MGTCMPQLLLESTLLWRHPMLGREMKLKDSTTEEAGWSRGRGNKLNTINKIDI